MNHFRSLAAILIISTLLSGPGCKKEAPTGSMTIMMTDAPALYSKVNIEVKQVEAHYEDQRNGSNGWIALSTKEGIYNLLDLRNNITVVLANSKDMPPGKVNQIRLILGQNNTVETEDGTFPLKVPSGYTSGLKIDVNAPIQSFNNLQIVLDFDAEKSVTQKGNREFELNPVIKVKSVEYN